MTEEKIKINCSEILDRGGPLGAAVSLLVAKATPVLPSIALAAVYLTSAISASHHGARSASFAARRASPAADTFPSLLPSLRRLACLHWRRRRSGAPVICA